MAEELRWEVLSPASATTDTSSAAEFRNDSSRIIHVREINWAHFLLTGANDEGGVIEISKSPVIASATNNNVFFVLAQSLFVNAGTTGSGADDVAFAENGGRKWAKGQLTLEPGESLYINYNIIAGTPTLQANFVVGYHF